MTIEQGTPVVFVRTFFVAEFLPGFEKLEASNPKLHLFNALETSGGILSPLPSIPPPPRLDPMNYPESGWRRQLGAKHNPIIPIIFYLRSNKDPEFIVVAFSFAFDH